jgi:hypothetical protein
MHGQKQDRPEVRNSLMDPSDLLLVPIDVDRSEDESRETQCEHNYYDLESYEMVERVG